MVHCWNFVHDSNKFQLINATLRLVKQICRNKKVYGRCIQPVFKARTKRAFLKNEKIFDIFTAFEIVAEFQPATVCTNSPFRNFFFLQSKYRRY